jgi:GNAT superfamily N-acetyltransferase
MKNHLISLISPTGTPISVRPILREELDRVVLRCWPDRDAIERLFTEQGTIGMAAWEGDKNIAQLHCYRVTLPQGRNQNWPKWNRWLPEPASWLAAAAKASLPMNGPAWCHACCHVGRTLETFQKETRPESRYTGIDERYFSRGIATALCQASIQWAREHDYAAMLAPGAPHDLFEFAVWSGHIPWTTYAKLGFEELSVETEGDDLPAWAQGDSPPEVMAEVRAALAAGRPVQEFRERLMALNCDKAAHAPDS